MFTGIIENLATLRKIEKEGSNVHLTFSSTITHELQIDQSLAHNGVCLTVVAISNDEYTVTAIHETLQKTNLGALIIKDKVNLERCTRLGARLDGHIVQGHIDTTARCIKIEELEGSWKFTFTYLPNTEFITVEKGSVTVNGVSLTVVDSLDNQFSVCIIPYSFDNTTFNSMLVGSAANIEFDIIGKYIAKLQGQKVIE
ncbi:MAG: riboflavin synthase [Crocinitomicaceae bacterium]|jgi:riboflavin synthase|nr:riboflavin synthase [Crocinitomicaceae bacterium]MBT5402907.1 riboflavin synthase [Crocinitomicaceae bacterium]MBT6028989.1 riboflavin synthase [Crocinitomicaceae bacterium]MBT6514637.1 riboflavin synthase [Crocinitomicaceae bacterium]